MIFFVDNNGKIINSLPETVYQGSADTNNIYLIAPFAANLSFSVAFRLPNGVYTERYMMTKGGQLDDIEYSPTQNMFALWKMSVPSNITQYYGTVRVQFYAHAVNGAITATSSTTFVVSQGVPEELPETPSADIYNQILTALSQLQSQLNNGSYAARAFYWWIDTYTYGMNEITFYPLGTYGALVRSLTLNNTGNSPYDENGDINSEYWQELVDFNRVLTAEESAAQSAAESAASAAAAAESAQNAAQSETNAAQSEQNAAQSETNAAQSEQNAAQSEQNAAQSELEAHNSAVAAEQSATDAAESAKEVIDYLGKTTEFVSELPEEGDPNLLYFVAGGDNNLFSIWVWEDGQWKQLGATNLVLNNINYYLSALSADGWENNRQTISLDGLTADDGVDISPSKGYSDEYIMYGIVPVEIVDGGIVFNCTTVPPASIALIINVTKQQSIPTADEYYTKNQTDGLITQEEQAREAADEALQEKITAEATARAEEDNLLAGRIDDIENGTTVAGKAAADENGNNISETYATQSSVNSSLAQKQNVTDDTLETTSKTIAGAINENKAAIDGLREDVTAQDHFKGFADTAEDVQQISGDLNDFVYCIATGTIWTYGASGWTDSNKAYPSDATPLSNTTPLMAGTGAAGSASSAARADHVHPTDTSRASATALQTETEQRTAADLALQNSVTAETTARTSADTALGGRIDNIVSGTTIVGNATNAVNAQAAENAVNATNAQNAVNAQTATTAATAEKVAHKLTITTGDTTQEFDGSADVNISIELGDSNDPNAVHFTQQTLSETQQAQARTNIGAAAATDLVSETNERTSADTALGNRIDNIVSGATTVADATNAIKATNDGSGNEITSFYAHNLTFSMNNSNYVLTATLLNGDGQALATQSVDLPLESVVVGGEYDDSTQEVVLTLQNGSEVRFSVADLVDGLASQSALNAEIAARQSADTNLQNKVNSIENGTTAAGKVSHKLTMTVGGETIEFDGSANKSVNLTTPSPSDSVNCLFHTVTLICDSTRATDVTLWAVAKSKTDSFISFNDNSADPGSSVEDLAMFIRITGQNGGLSANTYLVNMETGDFENNLDFNTLYMVIEDTEIEAT